jgi:hypothetical protein
MASRSKFISSLSTVDSPMTSIEFNCKNYIYWAWSVEVLLRVKNYVIISCLTSHNLPRLLLSPPAIQLVLLPLPHLLLHVEDYAVNPNVRLTFKFVRIKDIIHWSIYLSISHMIFYMLIMIMYIVHVKGHWITLNMIYSVSNIVITLSFSP